MKEILAKESDPYARYSDTKLGWDIYLDAGSLTLCLTEHLHSSSTEEEAWRTFYDDEERDAMNIKNYGFI